MELGESLGKWAHKTNCVLDMVCVQGSDDKIFHAQPLLADPMLVSKVLTDRLVASSKLE